MPKPVADAVRAQALLLKTSRGQSRCIKRRRRLTGDLVSHQLARHRPETEADAREAVGDAGAQSAPGLDAGKIVRADFRNQHLLAFRRLPFDLPALDVVGVGLVAGAVDEADVPLIGRDVFAEVGKAAGAVPAKVALEDEYGVEIVVFKQVFACYVGVEGIGADFFAAFKSCHRLGVLRGNEDQWASRIPDNRITPLVGGGEFVIVVACIGLEGVVYLPHVVEALYSIGLGFGFGQRGQDGGGGSGGSNGNGYSGNCQTDIWIHRHMTGGLVLNKVSFVGNG